MLQIPDFELDVTDEDVLKSFDTRYHGLERFKACMARKDFPQAKKELTTYFMERKNVAYFFDYRSRPVRKIDTESNPYFFQSALGLSGELKPFCMYVADRMLENVYVLPGKGRGEIHLGKYFENMIHFNFLHDQGKKHRHYLDQFVRGQFFESLAIAYHETEDRKYLDKFCVVLDKFFETYPLRIVDGSPTANRFQYDEDRDVMSAGWLCLVFISLLYTRIPYEIESERTFEIIKRIWFLGIQFRRFDTDAYRPYNHHLFERGLVPFTLGTLLPEIPAFRQMKTRGAKITRKHIKEDFSNAGGYSEHSIAYWAGAALGEMLTRAVILARLNNEHLMDTVCTSRLNESFSLLASLAAPCTKFPSIGDNRGPLIDPILRLGILACDNVFCSGVLSVRTTGATQTDLPPLDYANDGTGFVISRSGFSVDSNYIALSAKKRCGYTGHNHMDMLSLCITLRGKEIVGEPYSGKLYHNIKMGSPQRGYMYNMTSHNSVLCYGRPIVDDMYYSNKWGVYRPDSPIVAYSSVNDGFFVEAYHTAYTFCLHRRKLFFARNHGVIVHDIVERGNRYETPHIQRWHLCKGNTVRTLSDHSLLITNEDTSILFIAKEAKNISIWKNPILCPEIFSEEEVFPIIDVHFQTPEFLVADNAAAHLHTLFLDITGRTDGLERNLASIEKFVDDGDTLESALSMITMMLYELR
ncbi:MAG: heparinase II/III family protein [Sphaerochaetaceae bacterium]|jgi:hypothetical protein